MIFQIFLLYAVLRLNIPQVDDESSHVTFDQGPNILLRFSHSLSRLLLLLSHARARTYTLPHA